MIDVAVCRTFPAFEGVSVSCWCRTKGRYCVVVIYPFRCGDSFARKSDIAGSRSCDGKGAFAQPDSAVKIAVVRKRKVGADKTFAAAVYRLAGCVGRTSAERVGSIRKLVLTT